MISTLNKRALLLWLIFGWLPQVAAQNCSYTLRGTVSDPVSGEAVEQAALFLAETGQEVWSNDQGQFTFDHLCRGTYHLQVYHPGCESESLFLEITGDTVVELTVEHHHNMLHEVQVTSHDHSRDHLSTEVLHLDALQGQRHENIAELFGKVAGISVISNGNDIGKPTLHGLFGNRLAIINNGLAQGGQQWGLDHSPEIDPFAAAEMRVVHGAEALRYPGASLGGVLLVEPGDILLEPHIHGTSHNFFQTNGRGAGTHLRLEQGKKSTRWRVGLTAQGRGDQHTPDYYLRNTGTRQIHGNARIQQFWGVRTKLTVDYSRYQSRFGLLRGSHIGNLTDLELAFNREEPFFTEPSFSYALEAPSQRVSHDLFKAQLVHRLDEDWQWTTTYGQQYNRRREYDVRRGDRTDMPALSLRQRIHFFETVTERNRGGLRHQQGYQFEWIDNDNVAETGLLPLIPNYRSYSNTLFHTGALHTEHGELSWGLRGQFLLRYIAGISATLPREVVYYTNVFPTWDAHLGYTSTWGSKWQTAAELAYRQRPPAVNELYSYGLHQGVSGIEEGDPNLGIERGLKPSLQVRGILADGLHVNARLYGQFFDQYIYLQPEEELRLTIRGAFPVSTYRGGAARIYGADFTTEWTWTERWSLESRAAYLRGDNLSDGLPLVFMPPPNVQTSLKYDRASWGAFRNVRLQSTHRFVAQQRHWDASLDFMPPPEAYHLLELSAAAELGMFTSRPTLGLRVTNAANSCYRDYLNRLRYFADAPGRNILVSLTWKF